MKILVVGLGSMGKRRIRLMKTFRDSILIAGVDAVKERQNESETLFDINTYTNLSEAIEIFSPDAAFVCSPPLTHALIIKTLLEKGIHVFSEINLVSTLYDENIALAKEKGLILFLSSTPMYRKEIEYIKQIVKDNNRLRYSYHVGQYLPDWHPWENYTDFFIGDKRTSGIRELLAIELPWIVNTFSDIESFEVNKGKITDLSIDYDDCYALTLIHKNKVVGQLTVDVVCRKPIRHLLVYGEDVYLEWSGTPSSLSYYDIQGKQDVFVSCYEEVIHDPRYSSNILENAYIAEIDDFFSRIDGTINTSRYSFSCDLNILELIDRIERRIV